MFDLSYLSTIPNMTVLTPKDGNQLKSMLNYALKIDQPVAIRYPRGTAEYDKNIMSTFSGKNQRLIIGKKVDIWACGKMAGCGKATAEILKRRGIAAGLVDVAIVKPLDLSPLSDINKAPAVIATIEDNSIAGGFGRQMASAMAGKKTKVINFAWPDDFVPQGTFEELTDRYGLTPEKIAERICDYLEK